jgi:hypothetical protein
MWPTTIAPSEFAGISSPLLNPAGNSRLDCPLASGVTRADAVLDVKVTQHILATFSTSHFRREYAVPDRCGRCGSYKIGLRAPTADAEPTLQCRACGAVWLDSPDEDGEGPEVPTD